jgi:addiction module HigA family antidote
MIDIASVSVGKQMDHMTWKSWIITIRRRDDSMSIKRPADGWRIRRPPVHPGEMLREEFLIPLEISANRLAMELRVPVTRISEIVHGRRAVSADTALRLERYLGMSADFWLGLQKDFDLQTARQTEGKKIEQDIKPRSHKAA